MTAREKNVTETVGQAGRPSILMIRLGNSDIKNDSRVLREALSLQRKAKVCILETENSHYKANERFLVQGIPVDVLRLRTKSVRLGKMGYFLKYIEYSLRTCLGVIRHAPGVVHVHDLDPLLPGWIGARLCGARVIYDSHELYTEQDSLEGMIKMIWRKLERFLLRRVDGIIAANQSRAQIMYSEYGAPEMPVVVMNIPEKKEATKSDLLRKFIEQQGAPHGANSKIVLYQGGFSSLRGLEELVMGFEHLPDHYVLVLLGYGGLKGTLVNLIDSLHLKNRVFVHDAVPSRDLHFYTCSADLGVITYKNTCRNKYYCAPNKMFEYAMCGVPIVGADLPEIRKVLVKYQIGELFNPEDAKSIANSISLVFNDVARYNLMRSNLKIVRNDYSWEKEERKLFEFYKGKSAFV